MSGLGEQGDAGPWVSGGAASCRRRTAGDRRRAAKPKRVRRAPAASARDVCTSDERGCSCSRQPSCAVSRSLCLSTAKILKRLISDFSMMLTIRDFVKQVDNHRSQSKLGHREVVPSLSFKYYLNGTSSGMRSKDKDRSDISIYFLKIANWTCLLPVVKPGHDFASSGTDGWDLPSLLSHTSLTRCSSPSLSRRHTPLPLGRASSER